MKVLLFVPTLGNIPTLTVDHLLSINSKHSIKFLTTSRMLIDHARNLALKEAKDGDFDFLVMLDDDNPPTTTDFIDKLIEHKKNIVSGVIRLRTQKEDLNICYSEKVGGIDKYINYKTIDGLKRLQKIDNCGCGLICLSKKVINDMINLYPAPFESKFTRYIETIDGKNKEFDPANLLGNKYEFKKKDNGGLILKGRQLSEDLLFFERCRGLGYSIYCDTSIQCTHIGLNEILFV